MSDINKNVWSPMALVTRFRSQWNDEPMENDYDSGQPSQTVPDESLTVSEILQRYTRGMAPMIEKEPIYSKDEPDFDDPVFDNISDLTDVQAIREEYAALADEVKKISTGTIQTEIVEDMEENDA